MKEIIRSITAIKKISELKRHAAMSRVEFEDMQLKKFRKLVRHAVSNSLFYADIVNEREIDVDTCKPSHFPVLTKSMLIENFDQIVTDKHITKHAVAKFLQRSKSPSELFLNKYHVLHTSGSSGEVGYFIFSDNEWTCGLQSAVPRGSHEASAKTQSERKRSRTKLAYYAAIGGHFGGVSAVTSLKNGITRFLFDVHLFEVNSPLQQTLEKLNDLQPDILSGYTTALKILATKQREGVLKISPRGITTSGEAMTPADRTFLESTFGCKAINTYGSTEHMLMGVSNHDENTMTLFNDDLVYEFYSDHSVVTNLFNYTLPLIRYQMSDVLRPITPQPVDSPYIVVNSIIGRSETIPTFINKDGVKDFIHPLSIVELFIPGVVRFQMHLKSETSFEFLVCLDPALDVHQREQALFETRKRVRKILDQKLMSNVVFDVIQKNELPVDPRTGKFKLIISADVDAIKQSAGRTSAYAYLPEDLDSFLTLMNLD